MKDGNTYTYDYEDGNEKKYFTLKQSGSRIEFRRGVIGSKPFTTFSLDANEAETIHSLVGFFIDNGRLPNYSECDIR